MRHLLGLEDGVLRERVFATLRCRLLAAASPLLLGHLLDELEVDRRHLHTLCLRTDQLAFEPRDLTLEPRDGGRALGIRRRELLPKVRDQLLLRSDQRLLLSDDLTEPLLALQRRRKLGFQFRDPGIARVHHAHGVSRRRSHGKRLFALRPYFWRTK